MAVVAAEFLLLPRLHGLPRDTLLAGFAATPGDMIDGQRINRLGFTGDDISGPKAPGSIRVLLLGSSTMFNRHMADRLKAALQQQTGKTVELLNAGLRSHTTRADVIKLRLLQDYQWDLVLFYDGINDLWANHVLPQDFHGDYRQLDPWYRRNVLLDNSLVARYSYNLLYQRWLSPHHRFVFPKKPFINAANFASLASFRKNIEEMLAISRAAGAQPILLTFAFHLPENYSRKAFLDGQLDYSNPDNYDSRDVYNWGPPDYVREGLQQQNAILRRLAVENNVPLIDIDSSMSGHGRWFGDVCHFNDDGVDVFVATVSRALAAAGFVPAQ